MSTNASTRRKATTAAAAGATPWTPTARLAAVSVPGEGGGGFGREGAVHMQAVGLTSEAAGSPKGLMVRQAYPSLPQFHHL